ncbi:MAG: hypothetical protein RIS72_961, partial [Pseudomonadota bacterium]
TLAKDVNAQAAASPQTKELALALGAKE